DLVDKHPADVYTTAKRVKLDWPTLSEDSVILQASNFQLRGSSLRCIHEGNLVQRIVVKYTLLRHLDNHTAPVCLRKIQRQQHDVYPKCMDLL
ncbi:hypothetical protein PHYSODRAFT_517744, partial [Phytophthora sojae]